MIEIFFFFLRRLSSRSSERCPRFDLVSQRAEGRGKKDAVEEEEGCSISVAADTKIRIGRGGWRSHNGRGSDDNGRAQRLSKLPVCR